MPELDSQLLAELVDRHGAALKLYARQWCLNADDVVQQALIDLAGCGAMPEKPVAWLFVAVRRRAISRGRSDRRRQRHETAAAQQWFERRRTRHESADAATEALAELLLEDREIVIAHLWGCLTFQEIASLVGASASTAQRRYEAAIGRMRERMNSPCQKPPI
jgi:RNA polymerase sigma-70 factor (ECF subfamily)